MLPIIERIMLPEQLESPMLSSIVTPSGHSGLRIAGVMFARHGSGMADSGAAPRQRSGRAAASAMVHEAPIDEPIT